MTTYTKMFPVDAAPYWFPRNGDDTISQDDDRLVNLMQKLADRITAQVGGDITLRPFNKPEAEYHFPEHVEAVLDDLDGKRWRNFPLVRISETLNDYYTVICLKAYKRVWLDDDLKPYLDVLLRWMPSRLQIQTVAYADKDDLLEWAKRTKEFSDA